MALSMPIPPWLVTRPAEHVQASEAGMNEGLAAAHIWAQANQEKARLEESARQHDLAAAQAAERLQQQNIIAQQKLAVDKEYNTAQIEMARARIQETQDNAARMAQQWSQQYQLNQEKAAQLADYQKGRLDLSEKRYQLASDKADEASDIAQQHLDIANRRAGVYAENIQDLQRHRRVMEDRGPGGTGRLPAEVVPDDDLLKQRIAQATSQIKTIDDDLKGNPNNAKWIAAKSALIQHRQDLVLQRKKLRGYTGFNPVMGGRQMADYQRFSIAPIDEGDTGDETGDEEDQ